MEDVGGHKGGEEAQQQARAVPVGRSQRLVKAPGCQLQHLLHKAAVIRIEKTCMGGMLCQFLSFLHPVMYLALSCRRAFVNACMESMLW